jgi:uncharacterized protein (DUF2126 family)
VLPIQRWQAQGRGPRWRSERWTLRRGHMFLVPGDSPVGYRLPLGALPHVPPSDYPYINPDRPDRARPAAAARPAPRAPERRSQPTRRRRAHPTPRRATQVRRARAGDGEVGGAVRTALSVEPRDGRLCVFMPPVERVEDYLDLLAAAEAAAARSACPSTSRATPRPTTRAST